MTENTQRHEDWTAHCENEWVIVEIRTEIPNIKIQYIKLTDSKENTLRGKFTARHAKINKEISVTSSK